VLVVYWTVTYYGISIIETDLSVQKLAPPDARIVQFKMHYEEVIKGMQTMAVVVTKPGDLRDSKRFADVANMIHDYETAIWFSMATLLFEISRRWRFFHEAIVRPAKKKHTIEYKNRCIQQ
ncbi:hypothetical protein COOONC_12974, partial [Cooperia oncophora]